MRLIIENQFKILEKEKGAYHAFPTVIRQGDRLWMACRSGVVSGRQDHGLRGRVLLFSSKLSAPDSWTAHGTLFEPSPDSSGNELDAILSEIGTDLIFLATRDYEFKKRNDVYLSKGTSPVLTERTLLTEISDQYAICFGHIRKAGNGDLLMPGYCGFDDEPVGTPVLLVSEDRGRTWAFRAKVASSTAVGTRLTEYSLGHVSGTSWRVLIRNETAPYHFYFCESHDDGRTWPLPKPTDLCGHAPMILDSDQGEIKLVLYRDLSGFLPGVAIGISLDRGESWTQSARLASYSGSIYDGGYGDLVQLDANRYLAVYYLCDQDASPWIEGCVFTIG
jgi:hypothetical protein